MPAKIYRVTLEEMERENLKAMVTKGQGHARDLYRARILLLADEKREGGAWKDADIAAALGIGARTVERTRQVCVEEGIEAALYHRRPKQHRRKVLDGAAEARLIQLACSQPPPGQSHWTMQLLADELIALEIVETISDETVRTTLKKTG